MFGSHRSLFARHIGSLLVVFVLLLFVCLFVCLFFGVIWGVVCVGVFSFFSKTTPRRSDPGIDFF